jgi:hypothetical protein
MIGYYLLAIALIILFSVLGLRSFISSRTKISDTTLLSVSVSAVNESTPMVFEQIFSALHGVFNDFSFFKRLFGFRQDRISFEIGNIDQSIKFYVWMPTRLRNFVEGQLYAQYPDIEIEEVKDYAKMEVKNSVSLELGFTDPDVFPVKRYEQFEDKLNRMPVDPIAGVCSALGKLNDPNEQAWLQVVISPMSDKWRIIYSRCLNIVNKGLFFNIEAFVNPYINIYTTRKVWPKVVFFPFYLYFFFRGIMAGSKSGSLSLSGDGGLKADQLDDTTRSQHNRETSMEAATDKVNKLLFEVSLRAVYVPSVKSLPTAHNKLKEIAGSFKQYNLPSLNGFRVSSLSRSGAHLNDYSDREMGNSIVMNVEELATIYHFPHENVKAPNINWVRSKKLESPLNLPMPAEDNEVNVIGRTNFRDTKNKFGIRTDDRRRHFYIIGKTGMGKSTLLENMIFSDIQNGKGLAVVDPHGDLADAVLQFVPSNRINDIILFDPSDRDFPVGFNMLDTNGDKALNSIVASGIVGVFKKLYAHSWGPRLEHILRNTVMALLEFQNATMLGIPRMLTDDKFRAQVVKQVTDPLVKAFWEKEFAAMQDKQRTEAVAPILNKVGQFLSSPDVRNILGQVKSSIDFRFAMDKGKIVVINLSKGKLGEDNSSLLGSMLITKFQLDAMSRADIPTEKRKDFYLYVDEFQNFATDSFASILSEARKYKLNLIMANQYVAQMPEEVRDAVFGNVGTLLSMQVGFDDAEYLVGQYGEEVLANDLVGLNKYTAYMRLLVDGMPTKTFSLDTLAPPEIPTDQGERVDKIRKVSRERYSTKREVIEKKISSWSE